MDEAETSVVVLVISVSTDDEDEARLHANWATSGRS
jgi:hypothetical protein